VGVVLINASFHFANKVSTNVSSLRVNAAGDASEESDATSTDTEASHDFHRVAHGASDVHDPEHERKAHQSESHDGETHDRARGERGLEAVVESAFRACNRGTDVSKRGDTHAKPTSGAGEDGADNQSSCNTHAIGTVVVVSVVDFVEGFELLLEFWEGLHDFLKAFSGLDTVLQFGT